jgi:hypothetical protein
MYSATARLVLLSLALFAVVPASASERSKLGDARHQVEREARSIGSGIENTAKGIGNAVVEGVLLHSASR